MRYLVIAALLSLSACGSPAQHKEAKQSRDAGPLAAGNANAPVP